MAKKNKSKAKKTINLNEIALKVRKTWTRKPQTQVVPNRKRKSRAQIKRETKKRIKEGRIDK